MTNLMRRLCKIGRNSRGAAGLEAAIVLPLFIFFIIGIVELYQQYRTQGIIDQAAATIAQSVSQQNALYANGPCSVANNVCVYGAIAQQVFSPLDFERNGRVVVSVYVAEPVGGGPGFVWAPINDRGWTRSYPSSGVNHPNVGSTSGFPPARAGQTLIVVETEYQFTPFVLSGKFWGLVTGNKTLYSRVVASPMYGDLRILRPNP